MRTVQDRSARIRKHQDRPGQAKKVGAVKDRLGQIRTGWERSEQIGTGQDMTIQDRLKDKTRLDRSGQGM